MVKFIHCADLHLDSPFKSRDYLSQPIFEDIQKSAYESFEKIVDLALAEEIDFMIISGDLFDQQNRTLRAEVFLKKQFERLEREQIFVYLCHGNHDPLSSNIGTVWPDNVSVFSENVETYQTITKNGEEIYLHGFSYQNDASYENKLDAYPTSQGYKGIHIGILHGTYSKTSTNDRYTEFRLEDLNNKLYHYWALGHIHERQQLSDMPQIHYPGNIQGRHFKELGEKGCLLVEGDNLNLNAKFVPTQFIRFEKATLETKQTSKQGLFDAIQAFKTQVRKNGKAIYQLKVLVDSDQWISEQDILQIHEMISDYEANEHNFVFIEDLTIKNKYEDQNTLVKEFSPELIEDNILYDQAMNDLYLNPKASKYLENYSDFDRRNLIEHAEELLKSDMRENKMKIKSLEIYGYGKFIQRKIEFDESFTEIYGENEAGKSTVQAFIHSILFGFPTKKENEPRLEPRLGNQYGGKLTLIQDDGSLVDVERIKGSATGDVKVYLPNGTIKDETWLNKELNFISKRTYQGIFSFDVLGLQDIHRKMDETQLQNYLLQAGALGSTEFTSMREILSNKKEMLYKKNGRNPIINQQLEQLKELEGQIREEEAKLTSYKRLVDDKDKAERRLSTLKQNLTQLSKMHEQKQKEIALHEQTQEWKQLETQLNIEPIVFPEQGIDRYESAKIQTQNLKRDIGLREERLAHLKTENEKVNVPKQSDIDAFNHLHQQENEIKQKEYELKSVEKEIEDKKREKSGLSSNIGWQDVHHQVDDSEAMKSHVSNQIKNKQEQTAYIQQLERNIEENKIDKDTNNAEIESLEADIVPEENFEKKKQYNKRVFELQEKNNLYQKMKEAFDTEQRENEKKQNLLRIALMVLAVIGIGLTIFSFVSANIIFGIVFAILSLVFITGLFFVKTKEIGHSETFSKEIDDLQQQVNHLEDNYDLDFDLDDQYRVREQYQTAIKTKEAINKKATYLEDTLEQAKQHYQTAQNNINDVKADLFLSNKMSDELIIDSINTMNKIKEHDVHITELHKKAHELQQQLDEFYAHAQEITKNQFSYFNKLSLFHDIRQWLKEETNNLDKWNRNNEQIKLLESEVSQLHNRLNENSNVISQLFNFVNVNDEESYYQHHVQHQNYHQQMARFNDLSKYLENQNYNYDSSSRLSEKTAAQLTNEDEVLARQVDDYNDQYLELQSQVSDLNAKITDMETDKTLADLRHRFHILKNKVNDEAKDWASLSYLQALVEGHIKQIKDKRLPQVINEATNIFSHLTNGHYVQVTYANDDLMVKQVNGQMYEPVELSQSTKEILYIALRLSLIQTLKPYYPFPIIIDDAFVHFDKYRKDIMMNYLRQMPSSYQILYFTCVKDTSVPSKQIITLNKIEEGGK